MISTSHGTRSAYERHLREGTPTCDSCRAANSQRVREAREPQRLARKKERDEDRRILALLEKPDPPKPLQPCGTRSAYDRHLREGTPTCDSCRAANNLRVRESRGLKETREPDDPHGTKSAYDRHLREETPLCAECYAASLAYNQGVKDREIRNQLQDLL